MSESPRVVLLGAPGAGKGTQGRRLADAFDVDHVATGDIFRANADMETEYGTPQEYMERGELVPDEVVNEIVREYLSDLDGWVLDGYPRNLAQAEYLADLGGVDVVVHLDVAREELIDRLTGRRECAECGATYHVDFNPPEEAGVCDECGGELVQREDDEPETVETRLEEYAAQTKPVVDFYRDDAPEVDFVSVDGEQSLDGVFADVREAVERRVEDS
ncbi:MAG: adenylate kinase [Halobacteriaceae archaeon]